MDIKKKFDNVFKFSEDVIYIVIAILLIITAIFLLLTSITTTSYDFKNNEFEKGALHIIDRMLLTIMVVEILYTVRVSLKSHLLCAEPFLIVGLIAAIRRILVISVESAYVTEKFKYNMIEIAILGILIFIFVLSIIMLKKTNKQDS